MAQEPYCKKVTFFVGLVALYWNLEPNKKGKGTTGLLRPCASTVAKVFTFGLEPFHGCGVSGLGFRDFMVGLVTSIM